MVENRRTFLQVVGYICSPIDAYDRLFVLKFGLNYPCPISRLSMKMTQTQQDKDTVDINLTPQELQILSELDRYIALHKKKFCVFFFTPLLCFSRQYGFLQLNNPEHAAKKVLVVKVCKIKLIFFVIEKSQLW